MKNNSEISPLNFIGMIKRLLSHSHPLFVEIRITVKAFRSISRHTNVERESIASPNDCSIFADGQGVFEFLQELDAQLGCIVALELILHESALHF